ncbi:MAG: hypothetical protein GF329_03855 [Candidatus Lokiarchaeota archaeon]|nr:hypothetical protein [Candidatus Lokiarchaeota archaeon]
MKHKKIIFAFLLFGTLILIPLTSAIWNKSGNVICSADANQANKSICCDDEDNAIIVWQDYRDSNWDIYAQKIDASGTPKWEYNGNEICSLFGDQVYPLICCDGNETIISWADKRSGSYFDVYIQKLDSAGFEQWTDDGIVLCNIAELELIDISTGGMDMCYDGNGGAIIVWGQICGEKNWYVNSNDWK